MERAALERAAARFEPPDAEELSQYDPPAGARAFLRVR